MWDNEKMSVMTYPFYFINWQNIHKTNCMQRIKRDFNVGSALKSVEEVENEYSTRISYWNFEFTNEYWTNVLNYGSTIV